MALGVRAYVLAADSAANWTTTWRARRMNGYRSIHTAVIGPMGVTVEVQIRTHEMHEESELGVCAHWAYKDDGNGHAGLETGKAELAAQRIGSGMTTSDASSTAATWTRSASSSPRPPGMCSTCRPMRPPVDFAYRSTHRGGPSVPRRAASMAVASPSIADSPPASASKSRRATPRPPRREWLNPALGYVSTGRARAKIQAWFRAQLAESNITARARTARRDAESPGPCIATRRVSPEPRATRPRPTCSWRSASAIQLVIDLVRMLSPRGRDRTPANAGGTGTDGERSHGLVVRCRDRDGLLRDITRAPSPSCRFPSRPPMRTSTPARPARRTITMELKAVELSELAQAVDGIARIPDVLDVRRKRPGD